MLRRILLLLCLAFVVVVYAFPCFVLPIGNYEAKYKNILTNEEETKTLTFTFDKTIKDENGDVVYYYRMKGNKIELSNDQEFTSSTEISLSNAYTIIFTPLGIEMKFVNKIGVWATVGVGVVALLCVITIPSRKRS